ncbi:sulfur carrier protein ThiS adenylyltransferase ThiF [Eubacterium ventriosum]|uniref:sulfur carrier protein ThiS adenylyltransferase ThiF n=1 Tax=Eubacterium ventriosum TaxID=39496 RepID=UPI00243288F3|nr:sulfur carrier protein ThiS adenylyltransferase ThiF [Eubacterium ventriosum]
MLTKEEIREALVERHSEEVQSKLDEAKVAIAGLGGLGSNIAFFLTRIGIGHLHLIDFDRVDITNLNRQQYRMEHIGRYKTEALLEELREINPYLEVETDCVRVTDENVGTLFHNEDIICEAFDRPEAKAMLVSGVGEYYPDKILVTGSGMAGYGRSNEIVTRKINEHFYLCGDAHTEPVKGRGLMAPRVAICAAHQANLITELIIRGK